MNSEQQKLSIELIKVAIDLVGYDDELSDDAKSFLGEARGFVRSVEAMKGDPLRQPQTPITGVNAIIGAIPDAPEKETKP